MTIVNSNDHKRCIRNPRDGLCSDSSLAGIHGFTSHVAADLGDGGESYLLGRRPAEELSARWDGLSPVRNEVKLENFWSKATVVVEQLKANYWKTFRMRSSQGHHAEDNDSTGFRSLETTMRSEDLISDSLQIDGSFILIQGDLQEILLTILFQWWGKSSALLVLYVPNGISISSVITTRRGLSLRLQTKFRTILCRGLCGACQAGEAHGAGKGNWTNYCVSKCVICVWRFVLQTKGRTVSNTYRKFKTMKSRTQILDYFFRYVYVPQ